MVTWSTERFRSAMISSRSRYVSEYRRYHRTHKRMITSSKCRPRKSAGLFRVTIHRTKLPQPRLQQNRIEHHIVKGIGDSALADFSLTSLQAFLHRKADEGLLFPWLTICAGISAPYSRGGSRSG